MLKKFYLQELETFTHIIIEGRGFQGGSDEKMRMWLGREVVVAGLPQLNVQNYKKDIFFKIKPH